LREAPDNAPHDDDQVDDDQGHSGHAQDKVTSPTTATPAAMPTPTATNTLTSENGFPQNISSSFYQCLELSGSGFCQSQRSWGICPARARTSWIIRGALQDLMEVKVEEKKSKEDATKGHHF
jgi:hypothetical protein